MAVTSARRARRRLGRRAWHAIHLTAYLGVALAFSHQLATGHEFQRQPVARAYWWALYAAAVLAIVAFRIVVPVVRSLATHRLHVARVAPGADGVVTLEIGGRRLDGLGARSGQYLHWRFLAPGHRTRARPLSLSAAPDGRVLRLTARERPGARAVARDARARDARDRRGPRGGLTSGGAAAAADRADRGRAGDRAGPRAARGPAGPPATSR